MNIQSNSRTTNFGCRYALTLIGVITDPRTSGALCDAYKLNYTK